VPMSVFTLLFISIYSFLSSSVIQLGYVTPLPTEPCERRADGLLLNQH